MTYDLATINFKVYEGKTTYVGVSDVTLPSLSFLTQTLSGVGIAGNIEAALIGQMDAMTSTFNFRNLTEETIHLATPTLHTVEMYEAQQREDSNTGESIHSVKHVMRIFPKTLSGGTAQRASTGDPSGEYAVRYWAVYVDGKRYMELDPMNSICYMDGKDYLAPVRNAMGM